MGVCGLSHAPAALLPGKTRYPLYRNLYGPQGRVWTVAKNLVPTGFRYPDRQAVASRSTDWAIPTHYGKTLLNIKYVFRFFVKYLSNTFLNVRRIKRDI